jgi:hypothetical protein
VILIDCGCAIFCFLNVIDCLIHCDFWSDLRAMQRSHFETAIRFDFSLTLLIHCEIANVTLNHCDCVSIHCDFFLIRFGCVLTRCGFSTHFHFDCDVIHFWN